MKFFKKCKFVSQLISYVKINVGKTVKFKSNLRNNAFLPYASTEVLHSLTDKFKNHSQTYRKLYLNLTNFI